MADIPDEALVAAKLRWQQERAERPTPLNVRYDDISGLLVITFTNGAIFMVPARLLEGLSQASDADLSEVELLGETGLHWESLDVDFSISGLMSGIFGSRAFIEARRKGGQSRSEAKTTASRANGAKGGRPRKSGT
jgi:Protein of unknown function (DUF2442)